MEYHPEFELPAITAGDVSMTRILAKADTAIIELKMDVSEYLLVNELIWGWTSVTSPYHLSLLINKIKQLTPGAKYWLHYEGGSNPDALLGFLRLSERDQMLAIAKVLTDIHHKEYADGVKSWLDENRVQNKPGALSKASGVSEPIPVHFDTSTYAVIASSSGSCSGSCSCSHSDSSSSTPCGGSD